MTKEQAARESTLGIAVRTKDDGSLMFWADGASWTQIAPIGTVKKWGGRRADQDDWRPLLGDGHENQVWADKRGPIGLPEWKVKLAESRTGLVFRLDPLLVRDAEGRTWIEVPSCHEMVLLGQGFRHYKGWMPVPEGHPLAGMDCSQERIPYRNRRSPPPQIADDPIAVDEWVETGNCPSPKNRRAEIQEHNAKIDRKKLYGGRMSGDNGESNGLAAFLTLDPKEIFAVPRSDPAEQVLQAIGPMATSLGDTIKCMVGIGEKEMAVELAKKLGHLIGNSSWLLREDRAKWAKN